MHMTRRLQPRHSLPPMVDGKVVGCLALTVDEILWCKKSRTSVAVLVKWWGENKVAVFKPLDVKTGSNRSSENTTVYYDIRTNINLFEEYLKDCEVLELFVTEQEENKIIGSVTIRNLLTIIEENPYQCYFPIVNAFGNRIGDLHIRFNLQFSNHCQNADGMINVDKVVVQELPKYRFTSKENIKNTERRKLKHRELKHCHKHCKIPSKDCENLSNHSLSNGHDIYEAEQPEKKKTIVPNSVILNILEQGQKLRDAMIRSILEDGDVMALTECDINVGASSSNTNVNTVSKGDGVICDDEMLLEFLLGKKLTPREEQFAVKTLKNMSPVASLLEIAEEMGRNMNTDNKNETCKDERKKMTEMLLDSKESSFSSDERNGTGEDHEQDILDKENNMLIQLGTKNLLKQINSLRVTIHCLTLNTSAIYKLHNQLWPHSCTIKRDATKLNSHGSVYFVEYELPHVFDSAGNTDKKVVKGLDVKRNLKNNRPWHSTVKRFCSRKQVGTDVYFEQSSVHMLPRNLNSLHNILKDLKINFKIYARQLHQRLPSQIGETFFAMNDILKSETLDSRKDIKIMSTTKISECRVLLGILKVTVELGSRQKCFGKSLLAELNHEDHVEENCENFEVDVHEHNEVNMKHLSGTSAPRPTPRSDVSSNSPRISKSRRKKSKQKTNLGKVPEDSSESETKLNGSVLLRSLLHISEGRGFSAVNSYLVCRAFWKDDIITSDICWGTGNPHYNFHQVIPILLSEDLLERSHNNFLVVEVWEKNVSTEFNTLIGIAKLPLNRFYIAYRDPIIVDQLLLSKYPVISVDGWVIVSNPITGLPSGRLHVMLGLGTEDQVQLMEVSRGLREAIYVPPVQCAQVYEEPVQPPSVSRHNIDTIELSSHSSSNHDEQLLAKGYGVIETQEKDINNRLLRPGEVHHNPYGYTLPFRTAESVRSSTVQQSSKAYVENVPVDVMGPTYFPAVVQNPKIQNSVGREFQEASFGDTTNLSSSQRYENLRGSTMTSARIPNQEPLQYTYDRGGINSEYSLFKISANEQSITGHHEIGSISESDVNQLHFESGLVDLELELSTYQPTLYSKNKPADTRHQESQTDLIVLDLTGSETLTLQEFSKVVESAKNHLPSRQGLSVIGEANSSSNISDIQQGDSCQLQNSEVSENRLCTVAENTSHYVPYQTSHISDNNADESNNSHKKETATSMQPSEQATNGSNCFSIAELGSQTSEQSPSEPVLSVDEGDSENNFYVHVEVERAMHLLCVNQEDEDEVEMEPSTYVSVLVNSEAELVTPIVSRTINPVWHWHTDIWLPSYLLTNGNKRMIFKVWQCVNKSHKDPVRDIVLGFAAVDISVLMYGMPCVSGWFNVVDFTGQCNGQIKINITPLESISRFIQYTSSEHNVLNKQQACYDNGTVDYRVVHDGKCKWQASSASYVRSCGNFCAKETVRPSSEIVRNGNLAKYRNLQNPSDKINGTIPNNTYWVDSTAAQESGQHDELTSSFLSQALKQKLSELDEITQRLKQRLHLVTNDFSPPFLPLVEEPEAISDNGTSKSHVLQVSKKNDKISSRNDEVFHDQENGTAGFSGVGSEKQVNDTASCLRQVRVSNLTFPENVKNKQMQYMVQETPEEGKHSQHHIKHPLQANPPVVFSKAQGHALLENGSYSIHCDTGKTKNESAIRNMNQVPSVINSSNHNESTNKNACSLPSHFRHRGEKLQESQEEVASEVAEHDRNVFDEDDTDDFDKLTNYLMETSARELELENVFNPLLFQHLLSFCNGMTTSGFTDRHGAELQHSSYQHMQPSMKNIDAIQNDNKKYGTEFDNPALHRLRSSDNVREERELEAGASKNQQLSCKCEKHVQDVFANPKEEHYDAVHSEVNCIILEDGRKKQNCIKENNILTNAASSLPRNVVPLIEVDKINRSTPSGISSEDAEQLEACVGLPCASTDVLVQIESNASSRSSFTSRPFSELEFSNEESEETSKETSVFVLRQAPEGGNPLEEKKVVSQNLNKCLVRSCEGNKEEHKHDGDINCQTSSLPVGNEQQSSEMCLRPSRLPPPCFKHVDKVDSEETELTVPEKQNEKKQTELLLKEEEIKLIAKILNTKPTKPKV